MEEQEISSVDRLKRWDVPYADELVEAQMSYDLVRTLAKGPLKEIVKDRKRFPADLPLTDILRYDARLRKFDEGELVFREGEYGSSAFLVIAGGVNIVLSQLGNQSVGKRVGASVPKFLKLVARSILRRSPHPEKRRKFQKQEEEKEHRQVLRLQDFPDFLLKGSDTEFDPEHVKTLSAGPGQDQTGQIFGEIAAFGRTPRTASVLAAEDGTELLEIRWQGLRDIRKFSPNWKSVIDECYRSSSLHAGLALTEYTRNLSGDAAIGADQHESEIGHVARLTQFRSYGEYSWNATFKELAQGDTGKLKESEPLILKQGGNAAEMIIIRSGFVRVTRRYNHGEKVISYLGKGQTYGMLEIYHNSNLDPDQYRTERLNYQHSVRAVGYVDVLVIPAPVVESVMIPKLSVEEAERLQRDSLKLKQDEENEGGVGGKMMEFFLQQRAINGTASMFIDLNRCTHCDDCVRACSITHDNNPRFIRNGPVQDGIQLTHACMHCVDPVCMIGCPTGAIHREALGNQVVINESTCIGCSTCADNCAYDNIQMVELRDRKGDFQLGTRIDETSGVVRLSPHEEPIRKATKCDLCESLLTGPACMNACPHDALVRTDMTEPEKILDWIGGR